MRFCRSLQCSTLRDAACGRVSRLKLSCWSLTKALSTGYIPGWRNQCVCRLRIFSPTWEHSQCGLLGLRASLDQPIVTPCASSFDATTTPSCLTVVMTASGSYGLRAWGEGGWVLRFSKSPAFSSHPVMAQGSGACRGCCALWYGNFRTRLRRLLPVLVNLWLSGHSQVPGDQWFWFNSQWTIFGILWQLFFFCRNYRFRHPGKDAISLSINIFSRSKCPKKYLIWFWKQNPCTLIL